MHHTTWQENLLISFASQVHGSWMNSRFSNWRGSWIWRPSLHSHHSLRFTRGKNRLVSTMESIKIYTKAIKNNHKVGNTRKIMVRMTYCDWSSPTSPLVYRILQVSYSCHVSIETCGQYVVADVSKDLQWYQRLLTKVGNTYRWYWLEELINKRRLLNQHTYA